MEAVINESQETQNIEQTVTNGDSGDIGSGKDDVKNVTDHAEGKSQEIAETEKKNTSKKNRNRKVE